MKKVSPIFASSVRMRPNHRHGSLWVKYLIRAAVLAILFSGFFASQWLLHCRTKLLQRSSPAPSAGGFLIPGCDQVSNETIAMYSKFNPSIYAERERIKFLLHATDFGTIGVREALKKSTHIPARVTRRPVSIHRANAWTYPFLDGRTNDAGPTFLQISKTWLGDEDDSNPRTIMQDLIETVKKPLDQSLALHLRKRLPDEEPLEGMDRYRSCAVVGNSGILLNGSHGKEIDSHQMVIRLNNAELRDYAEHVGSKTTISFVNGNVFQRCTLPRSSCDTYGHKVPVVLYLCQAVNMLYVAKAMSKHPDSTILVTHSLFDALCGAIVKWYSVTSFLQTTGRPLSEWDSAHDEIEFHYSSGMQAVMLALGICDSVDLYGFGKLANATHHYHTLQKEEFSLHDYDAEYIFYNDVAHNRTIPFLSEAGVLLPPLRIFF